MSVDLDLKKLEKIVKETAVGDTMYEKKSVIEKVLKVGKHFQSTNYLKDGQAIELQSDIEDLMCTLWDISVEEDVSMFYLEYGVLDILVELFTNPNNRVKEISVGIMSNMVFHLKVFMKLIDNDIYLEKCIKLLEEKDSPTLILVFKCLHSYGFNLFNIINKEGIKKEEIKQYLSKWLVFLSIESVVQNIGIIIASCTNKEVLLNASKFLSIMSELWEESEERRKTSQFFSEEQFLLCILEGINESVGEDKTEKHFMVFLNAIYEQDIDKEVVGSLSEKVMFLLGRLISDHVLEYNRIEESDLEFIFNLSFLLNSSSSSGAYNGVPSCLVKDLQKVKDKVLLINSEEENGNITTITNLLSSAISNLQSFDHKTNESENDTESSSQCSSAGNSPLVHEPS